MPLLIQNILPRSLAAKKGIKTGETIIAINGNPIRDFIDLQFHTADQFLSCEVQNAEGKARIVEITRNERTSLGIEPEPHKHSVCRNKCVFCYVDQMPPGLRESLYNKDDDYLFSFVFGNYITLTNLSEEQYRRIIQQKLSPIYISVHTTNPVLRQNMMCYAKEFDVLSRLNGLAKHGIRIHAQIVLVPGWNNGGELERTLDDLLKIRMNILSVGIVPVGLTRFREHLPELHNLTREDAAAIIALTERVRVESGKDFVYVSDEIFIKAGVPIPPEEYYNEYPQLENGIGMVRLMLENWHSKKRKFVNELKKKGKPLVIGCGVSAFEYVKYIAEYISAKAENCPVRVIPVINHFMGENITVSGLLTFTDIRQQVIPQADEIIVLPGNIFNHDGITLDGIGQLEIKEHWQREILIIDPMFEDWEWL